MRNSRAQPYYIHTAVIGHIHKSESRDSLFRNAQAKKRLMFHSHIVHQCILYLQRNSFIKWLLVKSLFLLIYSNTYLTKMFCLEWVENNNIWLSFVGFSAVNRKPIYRHQYWYAGNDHYIYVHIYIYIFLSVLTI